MEPDTDYSVALIDTDGEGESMCSGTVLEELSGITTDAMGGTGDAPVKSVESEIDVMGDDTVIGKYL